MTELMPGTADPGLHGPESVSWNLHADPAMWLAGITSLYLQALHPRAAAGVVQNSTFQTDPLGRLARTANFVCLGTYGPRDQVASAAAKVRAVHRSLRGRDPKTGETFRIDDPELLRWVHCAEVASFLAVVRRGGYPINDAQADHYLAEQRRTATLVGLPAQDIPGSQAELAAYFTEIRPQLARSAESDIIYRFLHWPAVPVPLRVGLPVYTGLVGHLAYSLLPRWAIAHYGRPAYPIPVATGMLRALRAGALPVPRRLRWAWPQPYALQAIDRLGKQSTPSVRLLPPG